MKFSLITRATTFAFALTALTSTATLSTAQAQTVSKVEATDPRLDDPFKISVGAAYVNQSFLNDESASGGSFNIGIDNMREGFSLIRLNTGFTISGNSFIRGDFDLQASYARSRLRVFDVSNQEAKDAVDPKSNSTLLFVDGTLDFRGSLASRGANVISFFPVIAGELSDRKHNSYLSAGIGLFGHHIDAQTGLDSAMLSFVLKGALGSEDFGAECALEWGSLYNIDLGEQNPQPGSGRFASTKLGLKFKPSDSCTIRAQYLHNGSLYRVKDFFDYYNKVDEVRIGAEFNLTSSGH